MNLKSIGILAAVGLALSGVAWVVAVKANEYATGVIESDAGVEADSDLAKKGIQRAGFSYNIKGARQKLESLGRVFVAYRSNAKVLPQNQWKTQTDAGLAASIFDYPFIINGMPFDPTPEQRDRAIQNLYVVSRSPKPPRDKTGKVVDLTVKAEDNKYADGPNKDRPDVLYPDFTLLAWPDVIHQEQIMVMLRQRGDRMPVLLDTNMYSPEELEAGIVRKVLVLRLNGKVDEVEAVPTNYLDILMNK